MMCKNAGLRVLFCVVLSMLFLAGCGSITRHATRGDVDGISKYIREGGDINLYDRWGWTPIMWSVYYGYYDAVKLMLENGANPNARTQKDYGSIMKDSTPLIIAAYYGQGGIANLLLKRGANPKNINRRGESAYSLAEKYNFTEILDLLEGKATRHYSWDKREQEDRDREEGNQTILMNDGSKIVGKIVSQTRTHVTVKTKYSTMTIEKDRISEMKFK
ncbi:MAG: ankyrin repeat domain-containing protein [Spirochaetes bacterium]|nr:ankyrin repeat domain-containing protein [Spirochaetota bacterium]